MVTAKVRKQKLVVDFGDDDDTTPVSAANGSSGGGVTDDDEDEGTEAAEVQSRAPVAPTPQEAPPGTRRAGWLDNPRRKTVTREVQKAFEETGGSPKTNKSQIVLPALNILTFNSFIVGDSELICHRWSEKAWKEMLGRQTGEPSAGREKKDPLKDFLGSLYTVKPGKVKGTWTQEGHDGHPDVRVEGGEFVFPSIAVKCAMVEACTSLGKSITKVAARQCFQVLGETFPVYGQPRMRRDMVRLKAMGNPADIRFRGGFEQWYMPVRIRFNARVLTMPQLINLLNTAGFAVGIGEWRSEKDGAFGLFHVADGNDMEDIARKYGKRTVEGFTAV